MVYAVAINSRLNICTLVALQSSSWGGSPAAAIEKVALAFWKNYTRLLPTSAAMASASDSQKKTPRTQGFRVMSGPAASGASGDNAGYVDDNDGGDGTSMDASRDIAHIKAILEEAGVTEYDPRVVHLLLDLLYTTTSGLLTEAKAISQHCGKMVIDETDVQIAVEMSGLLCDGRPNRSELLKMASERNAQPLPQIRHNFGLKLPNDRFCLLQPNMEWRGSDRTTADLLSNNAPLNVGQPPAHGAFVDDSLQQLRPEHVTNLLKRPAEEDFDA